MKTLFSAVMIVKNEEAFLESCLHSIQSLVDEIVIADTGSTDRSKAIAEAFGARIYDFTWRNDFAAARNYALNHAQGKWVLYIDADERVRPTDAFRLKEQLLDASYVAHYVQLHPRRGATPYPELRIFRNDPRIRFQGRIHENIWPGINRYRSDEGGKIGASHLVLDHEGYEGDQQHKHSRNLPLLKKALREDPEKIFSRCHLASIYTALGKERTAKKTWKRALGFVRQKQQFQAEDSLPYIGLAQWGLNQNRDIQPLLAEAISRFPNNLQFHWLRGNGLMLKNRIEEAIPVFEYLLECGKTAQYDHAISYDTRLFSVLPLSALAACHFKLGNYTASGRYFELAANADPDNLEYRVKRELCTLLQCSKQSAALRSSTSV